MIVALGATLNDGNGENSGHVPIYSYGASGWIQMGTDIDQMTNISHPNLDRVLRVQRGTICRPPTHNYALKIVMV